MRIEGDNAFLEVRRGDDGETFEVRCQVVDFAGANARIWIDANVQTAFVRELRLLEQQRSGEARLFSMSPGELEVIIRVVDAAGHVTVEGQISRLRYSGRRYHRLLCKYAFDIDPTGLPALVRESAHLFGAA